MRHDAVLSPLRLQRCWLDELVVRANPAYEAKSDGDEQYETQIDYRVVKRKGKPDFRIRLTVDLAGGEGSAFQQVRVSLVGIFAFAEGTPEELVTQLTPLNQLSILYGMARGMVSTATASTRSGSFILPSINFVELMRLKREEIEAGQEPRATPSGRQKAVKSRKTAALPEAPLDSGET